MFFLAPKTTEWCGETLCVMGGAKLPGHSTNRKGKAMDNSQSSHTRVKVVRWIGRVLSALIIVVFGFVWMSEVTGRLGWTSPPPGGLHPLSAVDAIQFYSMAVILIGLGIAWKYELAGSLITLIPIIVDGMLNPRALIVILFTAAPAILFLLCWWWNRSLRSTEKSIARTNSTAPPPTNA